MKARFGSISRATMRPADLIPTFSAELRALIEMEVSESPSTARVDFALVDEADTITDYDSEEASGVLEELFDALNEYAPEYGYFGAHPGDGADYGFWLHEDWEQIAKDDGVLFVSDLAEIPDNFHGVAAFVTDHGNVSLYSVQPGCVAGMGAELKEIWSIV